MFFYCRTERNTAGLLTNTSSNKIPLHCCVLFIWVLIEESVATVVSSMAIFVVHAGFYSRVTEKTKAFLITSPTRFQEVTFSCCIFSRLTGAISLIILSFLHGDL